MDSTSAPTLEWAPPRPPADRLKEREWTKVTPLSVVKHLRLREMGGLPKFNMDRSELGIVRLLVKSRAPVLETGCGNKETKWDEELVVPTKLEVNKVGESKGTLRKDSDLKYTFMTLKDSYNAKKNLKIMFMDDEILIFETKASRTAIHVTEWNMWLSGSLTERYTVWGPKANPSSSRSPTVKVDMIRAVEMKGSNVVQERDILVLISKSKISTYDLQSGKLLDAIDLENIDSHCAFHCAGLSCFEDSLIGPCIKVERKREKSKSSNKDFQFEFLLLSAMPLTVKYRIQILKGALADRSVTKCELMDGSLIFYYWKNNTSQVSCLADVDELIKNNEITTTESCSPDPQFRGMKTVVVRNKPSPLVRLNMELSCVNLWSSPPCALGSVASNELTIYSLAAANVPLHRIVNDGIMAEPLISTYSSISGDILLSGVPHGFSILELRNKSILEEENNGNMLCAEVFSTESLLSSANRKEEEGNRNDRSTGKRSLRPIPRKNYTSAADSEKLYFFDYDCSLNLFVAIEFDQSERCIQLYLYDKQTKKMVLKLKPICIKKHCPQGFFICPTQSKVIINFVDVYIAISVTYMSNRSLPHSSYVYFVNLLGECVEEE